MSIRSQPKTELGGDQYLSTGLTLLNLATYGRLDGGLCKGHIYRIAGRSSAGKTFLARTILAEAVNNSAFDGYDLVYDDVERGALMDTEKFFGKKLVDRLVPPARSRSGEPLYSESISDFYQSLSERLRKGRKLIWVEDSMDSLNSAVVDGKSKESKMGDGKAKVNAQELRKLIEPLQDTGSILILVSQAHDDLRSPLPVEIASGGHALEYYSTLDIWLRRIKSLKKSYRGQDYPVGTLIQARIKKNRLSGQDRVIHFPFYPEMGIDDVGSCVDFLATVHVWERHKSGVIDGFISAPREELIAHIEEKHLLKSLRAKVVEAWREMQTALGTERRSRYT